MGERRAHCSTPSWLLALALVVGWALPGLAASTPGFVGTKSAPIATLFFREGCDRCKAALAHLERLALNGTLWLRPLDVHSPQGAALFDALSEKVERPQVVPVLVIGRELFVGFPGAEGFDQTVREMLAKAEPGLTLEAALALEPVLNATGAAGISLFGLVEFDPSKLALPTLALVLGLVDGVNPCALWVLIAFLTVLLRVGDRKKTLFFAGTFLLAQGVMYGLILHSWFLAFDFVRAERFVSPLVAAASILGGLFFLREARRESIACRVGSLEARSRTLGRLERLAGARFSPAIFLGILGLAFSVNVIEFACSIGAPQAFAKILEMNRVGTLHRHGLVFLYLITYMLDDALVFGFALWGAREFAASGRFARWGLFFGGTLLVGLGFVMLFSPGRLRF